LDIRAGLMRAQVTGEKTKSSRHFSPMPGCSLDETRIDGERVELASKSDRILRGQEERPASEGEPYKVKREEEPSQVGGPK
jgi:hypothetical protein